MKDSQRKAMFAKKLTPREIDHGRTDPNSTVEERDALHLKLTKLLGRTNSGLGMTDVIARNNDGSPKVIVTSSSLGFLPSDLTDLKKGGFMIDSITPVNIASFPSVKLQLEIKKRKSK